MLLDSYIANVYDELMIAKKIRIDRMMDHGITYGIRLAKDSEKLEKCLREYLRDNRQEVFDIFRKFLKPKKVRIGQKYACFFSDWLIVQITRTRYRFLMTS